MSLAKEAKEIIKKNYEQGLPVQAIADLLNAEGLKTTTGKPWANGSVYTVAHNLGCARRTLKGKGYKHAKTERHAQEDAILEIAEIAKSNLSEAFKIKHIKQLAKKL